MTVYNTLHQKKEPFVPLEEGKVGMYVCGPTVYNYIHVGNARPITVFDTIRRYLIYRGYQVTYVQNFTDVDDKIIKRSGEEGITAAAVAEKYIKAYEEDVAQIKILPADIHPKVTQHMPEIIQMVEALIASGHAYVAGNDVYFRVRSFADYGKLSKRNLDDMMAGARVEIGEVKEDAMDFALWKGAKPGEPAWESPWGMGRPGWHIECSAMSKKYLGPHFDIHGGGADLIFPHHENEIAQSEALCGPEMAKYWLHNGFITVNQEKMSKSLGNFFLLRDVLEKFSGEVVRFYLLSTHYRSPIDFDDEKLSVAAKGLERITNCVTNLEAALAAAVEAVGDGANISSVIEQARADFIAAMDDDFNTALAIAVIFDFCREVNSWLKDNLASSGQLQAALDLFTEWHSVLGVILPEAAQRDDLTDGLMALIMDIRGKARTEKNWALADQIRDALKAMDIVIEDTPQGPRWKQSK
ncbi:MAG: cysteine--tRNA ligase [Peptococcaceae bacterium]|nr:cysteine--tRNA ligase [Peptococcaceae bacterium]